MRDRSQGAGVEKGRGRMSQAGGVVVVLGSVNRDVVAEVAALPGAGETVIAHAVRLSVGGKGANQAVAAHRLGANVTLVARLGDDPDSVQLRTELVSVGLDVRAVRGMAGYRSGTAYIAVSGAENTIIVDPGANHSWPDGLGADTDAVASAALLVLQHEIPERINKLAVQTSSARVILNAAPSRPVSRELLSRCDPLVVNEHELADQVGSQELSAIRPAMRALIERGARSVVATLGAAGAAWCTTDDFGQVNAIAVDAVDSTGAGDALVGALAGELAAGAALPMAVEWAVAAASASVRATGTHASYPDRDVVLDLLHHDRGLPTSDPGHVLPSPGVDLDTVAIVDE